MPLTMRPTGLATAAIRKTSITASSAASGASGASTRPAPAPPICAGSGRSTRLASQQPYAPTTARRRWTRPRPSSRRAGSSGRRGRGWRRFRCYFLLFRIACSSNNLVISDRVTSAFRARRSTSRRKVIGSRSVTTGSRPVTGRPRRFFGVAMFIPIHFRRLALR